MRVLTNLLVLSVSLLGAAAPTYEAAIGRLSLQNSFAGKDCFGAGRQTNHEHSDTAAPQRPRYDGKEHFKRNAQLLPRDIHDPPSDEDINLAPHQIIPPEISTLVPSESITSRIETRGKEAKCEDVCHTYQNKQFCHDVCNNVKKRSSLSVTSRTETRSKEAKCKDVCHTYQNKQFCHDVCNNIKKRSSLSISTPSTLEAHNEEDGCEGICDTYPSSPFCHDMCKDNKKRSSLSKRQLAGTAVLGPNFQTTMG